MSRGRPRTFDPDAALDAAMRVFWSRGYAGASMADLTAATGLNKPSLYAAFGAKAQLYLKALDRYGAQAGASHAALLEAEPDLRRALGAYLRSMAAMDTCREQPGGCFVVTGAASCGGGKLPEPVERALVAACAGARGALERRFASARAAGQLPAGADPAVLADLFATLLFGMAMRAKSGASRECLEAVIEAALAALPAA